VLDVLEGMAVVLPVVGVAPARWGPAVGNPEGPGIPVCAASLMSMVSTAPSLQDSKATPVRVVSTNPER